ncbi:MAG: hypothetical protein NC131_05590 [Roseburia sp.]|nr:hypothetical protein [Roseburia sp.]
MKKSHKALIGLTSVVMAFSVTAMAACGSSGGGSGNTPAGVGDNNITISDTEIKNVSTAVASQNIKAVTVEMNTTGTTVYASTDCDENGKKLSDAETRYERYKSTEQETIKTNLKGLYSDMFSSYKSEVLDKDGNPVTDGYTEEGYGYTFMRDFTFYYVNNEDNDKITDFSNVDVVRNDTAIIPDMLKAVLAAIPETGVSAETVTPITGILSLADVYGAKTSADNKITLNYNKVAYKLYSEAVGVIDKLDENTTVGGLIAEKPVKALIMSLTYGLDAKELYDEVYGALVGEGGNAQIDAMLAELPKPAAGDSVYKYLVTLLKSQKFAETVFAVVMPEAASLTTPKAFADMKVADVVKLVAGNSAPAMAQVKTYIKGVLDEYVTVTEDKVTVSGITTTEDNVVVGHDSAEISGLTIVYDLNNDKTVSAITISAHVVTTSDYIDYHGSAGTSEGIYYDYYSMDEITETSDFSIKIGLSKDEYTLTNITLPQ